MLTNNKKLSLVIPTYNRSSHLDAQLAWAVKSINGNWDEIELVICDNASSDNTVVICEKWSKLLGNKLRVFRNIENVGLVGNCFLSLERAEGDFVWLVGDDDPISEGAVSIVLDLLQKHADLNIIHINHRCVSGLNGDIVIPKFYDIKQDIYQVKDTAACISDILLNHDTGGFMFITANVINRDAALTFIRNNPPEDDLLLVYPMFLNIGLASIGSFYLITQCLIDCIYETSSWLDKLQQVRYEQVPKTLLKLKKFGIANKSLLYCLNFQFSNYLSFRDILYKIRKNPRYARQVDFISLFRRLRIKSNLTNKFRN